MARKVPLKVIPLSDETDEKLDYREMFLNILRSPSDPKVGIDYEEMGKRLGLITKVRDAEDFLLLEDAEWRELSTAFKAHRFGRVFESIVEMGDDLLNAEAAKLEVVDG